MVSPDKETEIQDSQIVPISAEIIEKSEIQTQLKRSNTNIAMFERTPRPSLLVTDGSWKRMTTKLRHPETIKKINEIQ